jgi:hypothetical protein
MLLLGLAGRVSAAALAPFPAVPVTDLNGLTTTTARGVSGPCLVVVGFSHASGGPSKLWQEHFCGSAASPGGCAVVEVVELESAPFFVVPLVRRALRNDVPAALWGHVFIARQGQQTLKAALGFDAAAPDDPYLALVDGRGNLAWYGHGPWSQGRQDALGQALQLLREGVKISLGGAQSP